MKPGKTGLTRLSDATRYSIRGLAACWKNEEAFRQNVLLDAVLLPVSFFVAQSAEQWLVLIIPMFLLLMIELLNSAIEATVDRIGPEHHELSGRAKDMASAATFLCLMLNITAWVAITWQNFF